MTRPIDYWISGEGMRNITPPGDEWPEGEEFKTYYPDIFFGQDVVEFGCGRGRLAPLFSRLRYHGVDVSPFAIQAAQAHAPGYRFDLIDETSPIEGGHVLFAHSVLMHVPDVDLRLTLARFTQRRIIVSEVLGEEWRREGNPPVFNRGIGAYNSAFADVGYRMHRVSFKPSARYENTDLAILEFHRER